MIDRGYTYPMRPDIVNLRQFYSSRLGTKVKRRLRRILQHYWSENQGLHVVGIGYPNQLLPLPQAPSSENARIAALMPIAQGAIYWPVEEANHSILGDEMRPPFSPSSLHRVLMLHGFEHVSAPDELLRIWWQLLVPGGRLMLMVPNRRSLWARLGTTPFSTGTPYTIATLKKLLDEAGYTLRDIHSALHAPPSAHPLWLFLFSTIEAFGAALFPRMGGVLVIEAEKQIYAGIKEPVLPAGVTAKWATASASAMNSPRRAIGPED